MINLIYIFLPVFKGLLFIIAIQILISYKIYELDQNLQIINWNLEK